MSKNVMIGWLSDDVPDEVPGLVERAWQTMLAEPAWREWVDQHREALHDRGEILVWVDDGVVLRSILDRRLDYFVPVSMFFDLPRVPEVARGLLRAIYARRASDVGVPAPPPVR